MPQGLRSLVQGYFPRGAVTGGSGPLASPPEGTRFKQLSSHHTTETKPLENPDARVRSSTGTDSCQLHSERPFPKGRQRCDPAEGFPSHRLGQTGSSEWADLLTSTGPEQSPSGTWAHLALSKHPVFHLSCSELQRTISWQGRSLPTTRSRGAERPTAQAPGAAAELQQVPVTRASPPVSHYLTRSKDIATPTPGNYGRDRLSAHPEHKAA